MTSESEMSQANGRFLTGIAGTFGLVLISICAFIAVKVVGVGETVAVLDSQSQSISSEIALLKAENRELRKEVSLLMVQVASLMREVQPEKVK